MTPPVRGHSGSSHPSSNVPSRRGDQPTHADAQRFTTNLNQQVLGGRSTGQGGLAPSGDPSRIASYEAQGGATQTRYRQAVEAVANGEMSSSEASSRFGINAGAQRQALARVSDGTLDQRGAMGVQAPASGGSQTRVPTTAGHDLQPASPYGGPQPSSSSGYGGYSGSPHYASPAAPGSIPSTYGSQGLRHSYGSEDLRGAYNQSAPPPGGGHQFSSSSGNGNTDSMAAQPGSGRPSASSSTYGNGNDFFTQAQDPTRYQPR